MSRVLIIEDEWRLQTLRRIIWNSADLRWR